MIGTDHDLRPSVHSFYRRQTMPLWQRELEDATFKIRDSSSAESEVKRRLGTSHTASVARIVLFQRPDAAQPSSPAPSPARRQPRTPSYQDAARFQQHAQVVTASRLAQGYPSAPLPYSR